MNDAHESNQPTLPNVDGSSGINGQPDELRTLREECERLRLALAKAESERVLYLKALYEYARRDPELRQFENLDLPTLEEMSAGPVELISVTRE